MPIQAGRLMAIYVDKKILYLTLYAGKIGSHKEGRCKRVCHCSTAK